LLNVTKPTAPSAVLPTKLAAAEKHTVTHLQATITYTRGRAMQSISWRANSQQNHQTILWPTAPSQL
jgi:hypothetical protein